MGCMASMRQISVFLVFCVLANLAKCQFRPTSRPSTPSLTFTAKSLYTLQLDMKPTSVQLVEDPRESSAVIPKLDLVFMSHQPQSEIRKISDLAHIINKPRLMAVETYIVTDQQSLIYPNNVGLLPAKTLDKQPEYVWWVASGLFQTGSSFSSNEGAIYLIDITKDKWVPIAIYKEKNVGFSHTEWVVMDFDSKKDCITIKGSSNRAQLIWIQQPVTESGEWVVHPISNSSVDVGGNDFRVMRVRREGKRRRVMLIVVAGRRTGALTAYWVDDADNDWTQTSKIRSTLISGGTREVRDSFVSVEVIDLNGDGIPEILTSVVAIGNRPGRILAFQLPKQGFSPDKPWRRRTLVEWPVSNTNYYRITPGPAFPFQVSGTGLQASRKPHLLISGADDGSVYVLSPNSWSPLIWTYTMQTIFTSSSPIGIPSVYDVDGDGNAEIFIPTGQELHVLRYQVSGQSSIVRLPSAIVTSSIISLLLCLFIA